MLPSIFECSDFLTRFLGVIRGCSLRPRVIIALGKALDLKCGDKDVGTSCRLAKALFELIFPKIEATCLIFLGRGIGFFELFLGPGPAVLIGLDKPLDLDFDLDFDLDLVLDLVLNKALGLDKDLDKALDLDLDLGNDLDLDVFPVNRVANDLLDKLPAILSNSSRGRRLDCLFT